MNCCTVCKKEASKRCTGCLGVYYCSIDCQKGNWKVHKLNCVLKKATPKNNSFSDRDKKDQISASSSEELKKLSISSGNKEHIEVQTNPSSTVPGKGNPSYKLAAIAGKGMGVIAARNIKRGDVVLKELPVLQYKSQGSYEKDYHQMLQIYHSRFQKLSNHIQKEIMNLYCNPITQEEVKDCLASSLTLDVEENETAFKFVSICKTNGFEIAHERDNFSYGDDNSSEGLYLVASRFNHSCIPNVHWFFEKNTITLKAVRQISQGDELCSSYLDPTRLTMPPTIRATRDHLSLYNGFNCICSLCYPKDTKMSKEIEMHRIKYWRLYKEYEQKLFEFQSLRAKQSRNSNENKFFQDSLLLSKELINEMELGKIHNAYIVRDIAESSCMFAMQCKDDEAVKYFNDKLREASLIDLGNKPIKD